MIIIKGKNSQKLTFYAQEGVKAAIGGGNRQQLFQRSPLISRSRWKNLRCQAHIVDKPAGHPRDSIDRL
jgi:hypothetical protein